MSILLGITHPSQQKYKEYISEVLDKLPPEVRKNIHENCLVCLIGFNVGDNFGHHNKVVIILNTKLMDEKKLPKAEILHTIAHEFAHHILGHSSPMMSGMKEKYEPEADALAEQWGFP